MTQILIVSEKHENLMVTTIEDMADFKTTTIEHDKIKYDVQYVFNGVEKEVQILTANKVPVFLLDEHFVEDLYFAIGETLIQESIDYKEYIAEQHSDESRGN